VPRLGRRLAGRGVVLPGLAEIVGEGAQQVVCYRADVRLLRFVAQHGRRDIELPVRLLRVAFPASELRF
jgi:hypothetical protein